MPTEQADIEIVVNGEARRVVAGTTIVELLTSIGVSAERVAVELDRQIVKRPEWESTRLAAGARVEVVHFVGGG